MRRCGSLPRHRPQAEGHQFHDLHRLHRALPHRQSQVGTEEMQAPAATTAVAVAAAAAAAAIAVAVAVAAVAAATSAVVARRR